MVRSRSLSLLKVNEATKRILVTRKLFSCFFCNEHKIRHHALSYHTASINSDHTQNRESFARYQDDSVSHIKSHSAYDYNVRMSELGRQGKVTEARKLFDEIPQRDAVSYASMLTIYLKHNDLYRAEQLFYGVPSTKRSVVVDSAMVHAYATAGRIDDARDVFDQMPARNVFSWTSLISGYFRLGRVDDARDLFLEMPEKEKNAVTWTNVILGYGRNGLVDEARSAFDQMPVKNVVAWTAMIRVYVENDQIDQAFHLFHMMPQHNLYSWNIMIQGCLRCARVNEAKDLFDAMPWRNAISWTTMVTGLAQNGLTEYAREYFDQMPNKDIAAWNAMIAAYAKDGLMVEASRLFSLMPRRNIVTWNSFIDGYAKNGNKDGAFAHFVLMLRSCIWPDQTTLTIILTSCEGLFSVMQTHALVVRLGYDQDTSLNNSLITMYYRSGDITSAQTAFDILETKDVVSWTAMILAYSNHVYGNQALQLFAQMLRSGNKPDHITFVGVLSACSHAGLVKKGQMFFNSMKHAYSLEPKAEHYCCLIDILGRAGLVDEAVKVVCQIPVGERDGAVLGALVGACRLHGDVGLADKIGDELIELESASSGGYVLLANLYAACGKWEKFSKLRKKMKERKVKKSPGFSVIEVGGKSHVFLVGDRSHSQIEEIYLLLWEKLLPVMQDMGCKYESVPEYSF